MLYLNLAEYIQKVLTGSLKQLRLGIELNPCQPGEPSADEASKKLSLLVVENLLPYLEQCTELKELKVVMSDLGRKWNSDEVRFLCNQCRIMSTAVGYPVKWSSL